MLVNAVQFFTISRFKCFRINHVFRVENPPESGGGGYTSVGFRVAVECDHGRAPIEKRPSDLGCRTKNTLSLSDKTERLNCDTFRERRTMIYSVSTRTRECDRSQTTRNQITRPMGFCGGYVFDQTTTLSSYANDNRRSV